MKSSNYPDKMSDAEKIKYVEHQGDEKWHEDEKMPHHRRGPLPKIPSWLCSRWFKISVLVALSVGLLVIIILFSVVLIRTASATSPVSTLEILNNAQTEGVQDGKEMDRARRLAGALKIPSVSFEIEQIDEPKFLELHKYLKESFPKVHNSPFIQRSVIRNFSLLYTVTGSENGDKLPYLLASHLDVVPAAIQNWQYEPFGGLVVNDTFIYGRGALDDKNGVLGILEALEYILVKGDQPKRSFFMAFGCDEEVSGYMGAQEIAKELRSRGFNKLDFILDEGFTVTKNVLPGIKKNVALLGVSEKGLLTLEFSVTTGPGHSSFPPAESSLGILAAAMSKLEKNKLPSVFGTGPERATFEYLAPHVEFSTRVLYANLWLFSSLTASYLEQFLITNAMLRTTTAFTIFNGGVKDNIVPASAMAVVNHRIHPSQTIAEVIEYDRQVIDDPRVKIKVRVGMEAHPVSPYGSDDLPYQMVARSIAQTFEDTVIVPGAMLASTDCKWYLGFTKNIFRFAPSVLEPIDTLRIHGYNERITIDGYSKAVSFYHRIIRNADLIRNYAPSK